MILHRQKSVELRNSGVVSSVREEGAFATLGTEVLRAIHIWTRAPRRVAVFP